ncbi:MAG: HYR domain-containing protein [Gammaproteobacteria bacterium]|nr:HYR domain-containing protein [Gammaproteobacteria bacterium]
MANGYAGADDAIGDAWPRIFETQDNARTWLSRFTKGTVVGLTGDLGLGFGADPIMVCFPGGCAGFFIASNRAEGGGSGGGVYMALLPELNQETGFRHVDEAGPPRNVQLGTGDNFLDKIDAIFVPDTANPGTVPVTLTVDLDDGMTQEITREWPRGRFIVVYASINSSTQNVRIFSTFSDDYGLNWSPPKQVANTTGVDTGVALSAIGDTVFYAYRQFADDSGGQVDAVWGALSTNRGQTVRNPFVVVDNWCAFDQPTLPSTDDSSIVASRTNNFVDVSNDGNNFIMVLAGRLRGPPPGNSCFTPPFDYPAGSRVYVTKSGPSGKNWIAPVPLAPRNSDDGPRDGHSFQFMPALTCILSTCQAIWYDSIRDSIRTFDYLQSPARNWPSAANAFETFPLFGDFIHELTELDGPDEGKLIQFRRTADVYTRQFSISGNNVVFADPEPVRVTKFQLAAVSPSVVVEVEQLPFSLKQYKRNTVSFMGDYIGLAAQLLRESSTVPGTYEPNNGLDPANPTLKASFFAYWTDTRNARGQLYTENIDESVPFEKTPSPGGMGGMGSVAPADDEMDVEEQLLSADKKLGAEGVEDSNPADPIPLDCSPATLMNKPGETLYAADNQNRIKDADVYGALIEVPATAWVLNASKGLGRVVPDPNNPGEVIPLQRTYTIAARNEDDALGKKFRFRIMNQPVGFLANEARASWLQLPFKNFDNEAEPPLEQVDEVVGPQSSVTVALFVISAEPINPVNVNVYEVDASNNQTLVETLTVDGALFAGDLVTPFGAPSDVNLEEIHDPFVYAPTATVWNPDVWNPDVWNPDVWNPDVWNPDVWNPDVWNPDVWNPDVWNPDVWNPDVWNPDVWNVSLTDASTLDNPEIPSPDVGGLESAGNLLAKFDVQFTTVNLGNTTTPYTADFAANSPLVRQRLASGDVKVQIIVWQDSDLQSFQGCSEDIIPVDSMIGESDTPGQNRILAVADGADLLTLKIPNINNNRIGSVTYYSEALDDVQHTLRFHGTEATIREIAPELATPGSISYVVTSQAANTGDLQLDVGEEQVIVDGIPPDLVVNSPLPVVLEAVREFGTTGDVGVDLNLDPPLVTASKLGEDDPDVSCTPYPLGGFAPIGLGTTAFTCSAEADNGVLAMITFDVIAEDLVPPVLGALPPDQMIERDTTDSAAFSYALPTATDEIDDSVDVNCAPVSPTGPAPFMAPGPTQTEIVCTATDDSGNADIGSFFVTVEDTVAPALSVPAPLVTEATGPTGAIVTFAPPSAIDVGAVMLDCSADSGDPFPIGTTTVTCTATDDANLTTVRTFDVTVSDTIPPAIAPVADILVEADTIGGRNVSFTQPTATDFNGSVTVDVNCDADPLGVFYPLGDTTVTCTTAPDTSGLTASTSFTITVVDTTPPDLTVPDDITTTVGSVVTFVATADDIADPDPVVTCDPPSGSAFAIGPTTVTCTASDASGNSSPDGTFTVTAELGIGSGLTSNKKTVKAGSVAAFTWEWTGASGVPYDVGDGNQDVEARPCLDADCLTLGADMLDEDPGSSDIRETAGGGWQFNWQTVDEFGDPVASGDYLFIVTLLTTSQQQVARIKVTP